MNNYLGIDIGGTAVKIGVVTPEGIVLCKRSYDVAFDGYETPILTTVLSSVDDFLAQEHTDIKTLLAAGISATGQIDIRSGVVVGSAGHIKNYLGSEIKKSFEEKYGIEAVVRNDADCVAVAEQWIGRAKGRENVVAVTIGTGVGGGVIADGKLLSGRLGIAGELGHFTIKRDGEPCTCGGRGCYERYASMTALVKSVKTAYCGASPAREDDERIDGRRIFEWLWEKNPLIEDIVDDWIGCIADGLIGLTHIFNPEIIVLGGGVSREGEPFMRLVREKVLRGVMPRFAEGLEIEAAELGNDAGMIGAVREAARGGAAQLKIEN